MTLAKPESRVLGIDDGPFTFEDTTTALAGVMTRGGGYVEAVLAGRVRVDGSDATEVLLGMLEEAPLLQTVKLILLDGGAVGGFNVVDLEALHRGVGVPVAAFLRDRPDREAVAAALAKHFDDHEARMAVLEAQPLEPVTLGSEQAFVRRVGMPLEEVEALLRVQTVRGRVPEPLRIAHLVATAMVEGRSRGA